jgi:hypothetical protein
MMFREIITLYSENHMKHINALYGQNAELPIAKAGSTVTTACNCYMYLHLYQEKDENHTELGIPSMIFKLVTSQLHIILLLSKVKLSRYMPWRHMGGEEV